MNTIRWIVPLAGAGMLAAASIVGLERTELRFEPVFDEADVQAAVSVDAIELGSGTGSEALRAVVLPAGTAIAVILENPMSTRTAQPGDRFHARVAAPVKIHGHVVVPRGADIEGHVAAVDPAGTGDTPGRMQLTYELVRFDGHAYGLNSRSRVYEGATERPAWPPAAHGPEMEFDAGATLEFELGQDVAMMRDADAT